jgi:DNA-binding CsgD family transcriptional regulator
MEISEPPLSYSRAALDATPSGQQARNFHLRRPGTGAAALAQSAPQSQLSQSFRSSALAVQLLEQLFNQLTIAAILLDENGQVTVQNATARSLLLANRALAIHYGRLWMVAANRPFCPKTLTHIGVPLVPGPDSAAGFRLRVDSACGNHSLYADAQRLNPVAFPAGEQAVAMWSIFLFASTPQRSPSITALQQLLHLTHAEARVVQALYTGIRLAQIALKFQVSRETVKCHVGNAFRKCNVASQAQLIQHIASGPFFDKPRIVSPKAQLDSSEWRQC